MTDSHDRRDPESVSEIALLEEIRTGLRTLEDIDPGDEVWAGIQSRTAGHPASGSQAGGNGIAHVTFRNRWRPQVLAPLAMAAGLVVTVTVGLLSINGFNTNESDGSSQLLVSDAASDTALQALHRRSRELEPLVQGARYARSDSAERAFIYRIADVDSQLADAEPGGVAPSRREVQKLWGQRVALLESLAEVRRARAVLRPAVY
jgi:hypothetical protein